MLVDRVIRNLADAAGDDASRIDWLDLQWHECDRRALQRVSRGGVTIRIVMGAGVRLRQGDVLAESESSIVAVHALPTTVCVARPRSLHEMGLLALELGNLHAPVQLIGLELLVIPDGPVEAVFARLGVDYVREQRPFSPQITYAAPTPTLAAGFTVWRATSGSGR